jgi:hypothetical protein
VSETIAERIFSNKHIHKLLRGRDIGKAVFRNARIAEALQPDRPDGSSQSSEGVLFDFSSKGKIIHYKTSR